MRAAFESFSRLLDRFCKAVLWLSGAGLFFMTMAVAWQVWGRFVLNDSPVWTEPVSLMLMLWFILLAAAVGVRQRFHLSLDLIRMIVPSWVRVAMDAASFFAVGCFGAGMAWYTRDLIAQTWPVRVPGLGIPQGLSYLPVSLAGGLIVLFSVEHLVKLALAVGDARRDAAALDRLAALEKPNN